MKRVRICLIALLAASCQLSAAPNPPAGEKEELAIQGKYSLSACLAELRRKYGLSYVARLGDERTVDLNLHAADWEGLLEGVAAAYNVAGFAWGDLWLLDATERPTPLEAYSDYDKVLADLLPPKTPAANEGDLAKARELLAQEWREAARKAKLPKREYALRTTPVSDPVVRAAVLSRFREQEHLKTTPNEILRLNSLKRLRKYLPDSWLAFNPANESLFLCVPEPNCQVNLSLRSVGIRDPLPEIQGGMRRPCRLNFPYFFLSYPLRSPRGAEAATEIPLEERGALTKVMGALCAAARLKVAVEADPTTEVAVAVDPLPASAIIQALSVVCGQTWGPWRAARTYRFGGRAEDPDSRLFRASPLCHRLWLMRCPSLGAVRPLAAFPWRYLSQNQRDTLRQGGKVPYAQIPPRVWQWVEQICVSQALSWLWQAVHRASSNRVKENTTFQLMNLGQGPELLYCVAMDPTTRFGQKVILYDSLWIDVHDAQTANAVFSLLHKVGFNTSLSRTGASQPWFWRLSEFHPRTMSRKGTFRVVYSSGT